MYYPEELVEEVRTRNDIVDVISSYMQLTKKGSNYFGLCPFHGEKTASFSVSRTKQLYKCFGCGVAGNVISFVRDYENYTFPEAIKALADRAGIELPEITYSEEQRKASDFRSRLLEVNKEAGKFYFVQLRNESGQAAMKYLTNRGLSEETIKNFGLGYARPGQDLLYRYLKNKGFDDDLLRQCGIFNFDERHGMRDKFWSRVIFPIMDVNHRIIGFGGRVMGEGEPKYLNSPETPVFDKGRNLYGLNHARTSRKNNIILCEGYMDVISMHQAGFNQAVASLGTAFTQGQANLLKRYTKEVLLTYDSDKAGVKAALRAIPILRQAGLTGKVINLEPYKDPDEFIKNLGAEEFQKRIDSAENCFFYEIRMLARDFNLKDPQDKTTFAEEIARKILRFDEEIERDNYIDAIAGQYNMNPENLRKLVVKYAMRGEQIQTYERPKSGIRDKQKSEDGAMLAQKMLLTIICEHPDVYKVVKPYISPEDFAEDIYRKVATILFEQLEQGKIDPSGIVSRFEEEQDQNLVAQIFCTPLSDTGVVSSVEKALKDLLIKVRTKSLEMRLASESGGMDEISKMIALKQQTEQIANIKFHLE